MTKIKQETILFARPQTENELRESTESEGYKFLHSATKMCTTTLYFHKREEVSKMLTLEFVNGSRTVKRREHFLGAEELDKPNQDMESVDAPKERVFDIDTSDLKPQKMRPSKCRNHHDIEFYIRRMVKHRDNPTLVKAYSVAARQAVKKDE